MSRFDWSHLDAHLLRLLVAVVEAGSITAAAQQLGVTQSAVSHQLDKLRAITGDALFVKSGRGIVATARATALEPQARALLRQLRDFAQAGTFEPARWRTTLSIAANDFQRDVLLPPLAAQLRQLAPGVDLRIVPSAVPSLDLLRDGACDLVLSPRPPEGSDILQKRLFEDRYRVYYDPAIRTAPRTRAEYMAADHVTVLYPDGLPLDLDRHLAARGVQRRFAVCVTGFAGMPAFLRGSPLLAAAPALLAGGLLRDFASAPMPLACPSLPMYMLWHRRQHEDAAHRWLRAQVEAVAPDATAGARAAAGRRTGR